MELRPSTRPSWIYHAAVCSSVSPVSLLTEDRGGCCNVLHCLVLFSASMASSKNKGTGLPWAHRCHLWSPTSSWRTLRKSHSAGRPAGLFADSVTLKTRSFPGLMKPRKVNDFLTTSTTFIPTSSSPLRLGLMVTYSGAFFYTHTHTHTHTQKTRRLLESHCVLEANTNLHVNADSQPAGD